MLTVEGDKFVVARWIWDVFLKEYRDYTSSFDDESLVKCSDIAVLRNQQDFNKLGQTIMTDLQEYYRTDDNYEYPEPIVWSWHIPDPQGPIPTKMVLFRGEEEVCTVWFEQVAPLD